MLWYSFELYMTKSGENNFNEHLLSSGVDPSVEGFSPDLDDAYRSMNVTIATDRAAYASSFQRSHLVFSREAIAITAEEALHRSSPGEERSALVLGAGGCRDIPLEGLVSEFDRTVLVDADTEQTERALSDLPSNLLGKVSLIKADVAGVAKGFDRAFGQAVTARNYRQYAQRAAEVFRDMDVTESWFDPGEKYSFVCSQLLASQLVNIPLMHLGPVAASKFNRPFNPLTPSGRDDAELVEVINQQMVDIPTGHVDHLRQLVKDNGTVHFADTVTARVNGQWATML